MKINQFVTRIENDLIHYEKHHSYTKFTNYMECFFYLCTKLNINLLTMTSVSKDAIFGYFWIFSLSLIIHQFHIFFHQFCNHQF